MARELYISKEKNEPSCYLSDREMPTDKRKEFSDYKSLIDFLNSNDKYASELRARKKLNIILAVPSEDLVSLMEGVHKISFTKPIIIPKTSNRFRLKVWKGDNRI